MKCFEDDFIEMKKAELIEAHAQIVRLQAEIVELRSQLFGAGVHVELWPGKPDGIPDGLLAHEISKALGQ